MRILDLVYGFLGSIISICGIVIIVRSFGNGDLTGFLLGWLIMIAALIMACRCIFE